MNTTNNHRYLLLLFILAILFTVACSEESDPQPVDEDTKVEVSTLR